MISVEQDVTVLPGQQLFPDLYSLNQLDKQTNKNIQYFTQVDTDSSFTAFTLISPDKERQTQQLYTFDGITLKQLSSLVFYGHIYSVQLMTNKLLKVSTINECKQQNQIFQRYNGPVYETSIYDIETQQKKYSYKSKTMHKFHFLSEDTIVKYEKNKIHLYNVVSTFLIKYFLKPFQQNLVISTKIIDCQCFDDMFVLIHNVIKQQQTITVVEYYQYDKQKRKIVNICKLSLQLQQESDNIPQIRHYFNSKYNPVSVIFQLKMCYVINYTKREVLSFELPENNLPTYEIKQNSQYEEQLDHIIAEFKFTKYLDYQIRRWYIIYHSGYIQLINQDLCQDKLQIIEINLNKFHKTVVLSSNVQNMLSYDIQEVLDVIDGITYFYASQQNICEPSRTITDAIQQFILWIAAQYRDYRLDQQSHNFPTKKCAVPLVEQLKSKIQYFPFNQKSRNLFDYIPQSFFTLFTQYRSKDVQSKSTESDTQIMLNLNLQKKISHDHLLAFKQRFAQRVLDFHRQQLQNREESSCIQQLIDFSHSNSGHVNASQSNHSFAYRNRNIKAHDIINMKQLAHYQHPRNVSSEYSSYKVPSIVSSSPSPRYKKPCIVEYENKEIKSHDPNDQSNYSPESSEMSPADSLETMKKNTQYADLLTPQHGNYQVYNYEIRMKQIRDRIPCPAHINKNLHELLTQQFRMKQIFQKTDEDDNFTWFFDFQLQRIVKADTSCSFINYDLQLLGEGSYQTVLLYQDRYTQYSVTDLQEIFKLNLQRELFFVGLYKSGFLNPGKTLILQPQHYWHKYAQYVIENHVFLFTQSIINYLLITKTQVNAYICTFNYQDKFNYLREFLHTVLLHLLKLMGNEKSLFDQNDRLILSPNLWKIQHNFFQKLENHMFNYGYQDYSNLLNQLQIQDTAIFLPKSDGVTTTYNNMQGIQLLNLFDSSWASNNVGMQIIKMWIPLLPLPYQAQQTYEIDVENVSESNKISQYLKTQFYSIKYLFQNVYQRHILKSNKLYERDHSKIVYLVERLMKVVYNNATQSNVESDELIQCLADTMTQSIKAGVEYIAEYCDGLEQLLILAEVLENAGIPISEKFYNYYQKMLLKSVSEINNGALLIDQFYSIGVL